MTAWPLIAIDDYGENAGRSWAVQEVAWSWERAGRSWAVQEVAWSWERGDRIYSRSWAYTWMISGGYST